MTAFISHSFQNKPEFENIVDALAQRQVPYWDPADIKPGSSLRQQLREAVDRCAVCIFVATRGAIESSWCSAELGAFWGSGKPIIVYLAEPSLPEDALPAIVQGDVWERRIAKIADRAREIVDQAAADRAAAQAAAQEKLAPQEPSVAQLSLEQFERLIVGAVSLAAASLKNSEAQPTFQIIENAARGVAGNLRGGFRAAATFTTGLAEEWRDKILWVDDQPFNNVYERQAMESIGLRITEALSTDEALQILRERRFAAIISDMGRKEGLQEGYVLLEAVRETDKTTPFFIYSSLRSAQHQREAARRGAQGNTNRAEELIDMLAHALTLKL